MATPKHELSKSGLNIVKASAGSGKTYRLTQEYLSLLLSSADAYKRILAVTFTNKATEEMKSRIVAELASLALGRESGYITALVAHFGEPEEVIRKRSYDVLQRILHDYSSFGISTIDRFFQQVMRAFAREIGVGGGYNVELDEDAVLEASIDAMFSELENPHNKSLLQWLIHFSEQRLEDGKVWSLREDILRLSKEVFKESYKNLSEKKTQTLPSKDDLRRYKKDIQKIKSSFEEHLKELAVEMKQVMAHHDLKPIDFKYGKTSGVLIVDSWAKGDSFGSPSTRFWNLVDNESNWYAKGAEENLKRRMQQAYPTLNKVFIEIRNHFAKNERYYLSACEINNQFFTLGILTDITYQVRKYCRDNNLMLISDTTELLYKIIACTDAPFIYEKVGTRIEHYMIDEFQDTSSLQWQNFLPLLKNSMASGGKNLIVGDVKQSIYRWRNSDWKLLSSQVDIDFRGQRVIHESLDTNWRSCRNVIQCNNSIFYSSSAILQAEYNELLPEEDKKLEPFRDIITRAYQGVEQFVAPSKADYDEGVVSIRFIEASEDHSYSHQVLEQLPLLIEKLQDKGYALKNIAILVRQKSEGIAVANYLLEYKNAHTSTKYRYDIISDEALLIANASQVKTVIALLHYLRTPDDVNIKAYAVYRLKKSIYKSSSFSVEQEFLNRHSYFSPEEEQKLAYMATLPLYEMVEGLFSIIHNESSQEEVYVQAFLDMVLNYTTKYSSDIDTFLNWWQEKQAKETIFTPDSQDAIRIMTIHKSKGLGFEVVIIPFCNWQLDSKSSEILWTSPSEAPFSQISSLPVFYKEQLGKTIFAEDYYQEKVHAYIDNLNIQYVAFTRAKNELYVFAPRPGERSIKAPARNISTLLWKALQQSPKGKLFMNVSEQFDSDSGTFLVGEDNIPRLVSIQQNREIPAQAFKSVPFENRVHLRLSDRNIFEQHTGKRLYGVLMHKIVSQIICVDDLDEVLTQCVNQGEIPSEDRNELSSMLMRFFSLPQVKEWYSGEWEVRNEVDILLPDGQAIRPDRIMFKGAEVIIVDYKFGDIASRKYVHQVQTYLKYLQEMGYANIRGYLCYVNSFVVEEVTL